MDSPSVLGLFWLDHGVGHDGDRPSGAFGVMVNQGPRYWNYYSWVTSVALFKFAVQGKRRSARGAKLGIMVR